MSRSLLIGAGALGAIVLLERERTSCTGPSRDGRSAGKANVAAAADMRKRMPKTGLAFVVPERASMVCAWQAMRSAVAGRELSIHELVAICDLWLNAYDAGYRATSNDPITDSLYGESAYNYSMLKSPAPATFRPYNPGDPPCTSDWASKRSRIGNAICALLVTRNALSYRSGFGVVAPGEQKQVLDRTEALATAMDAADYVRDGERAYDKLDVSIGDALGDLFGDVVTGFLKSPGGIALLAIGGFMLWRALR
jgi:hypothetical protein